MVQAPAHLDWRPATCQQHSHTTMLLLLLMLMLMLPACCTLAGTPSCSHTAKPSLGYAARNAASCRMTPRSSSSISNAA
jgi:arginase family enzyme